jgi:alpha-galactosidase
MFRPLNIRLVVCSLLVLFAHAAFSLQPHRIPLTEGWRFLPGDNPEYMLPGFDDTGWKPIGVDRIWEEQGYDKLDGFAWYRIRFVLPSALRTSSRLGDGVRIFLGKINNFDQSFLNGRIFGMNGKTVSPETAADTAFLKADMSMWNVERTYALSVADPRLRWDTVNVLAVRVYDQGGQGGIWTGNPHVRMMQLLDYLGVDIQARPFAFLKNEMRKTFSLRNTSGEHAIRGTLITRVRSAMETGELLRETTEVALDPGAVREVVLSVPQQDQPTRVLYAFALADTSDSVTFAEEVPYILTPAAPASPRINGPRVYGARAGRPFLFAIAASGERPMTFSARPLPAGLTLDPQTGIISGRTGVKGTSRVTLTAQNARGSASRDLELRIGDKIALTPPLGWNSWNCWGLSVDEAKVLASARLFKAKGLLDHGWSFINIDDGWEIKGDSPLPKRDGDGNILTNDKFPDMKRLGDSVHALGLKFGIYSSPGPLTCGGYTASYRHEIHDAHSYAQWGIDYLKYDWCSYGDIAKDTSRAELQKPYAVMRAALQDVPRDIVYSLCQYGMGKVWEWGADVGGNLWRTTGDITDTWESMSGIGFSQMENAPFAGPGSWNDPDMLVVGWVGWGPSLHPTKLTPDEQYTHISLWCLLASPLLIGCDLERLDPFTLNLLTNDEVLAVNQDPLGRQAVPVFRQDSIQVWAKVMTDGSHALGVFNLGSAPVRYALPLDRFGSAKGTAVRDLWRQRDLGTFAGTMPVHVPAHGVMLLQTRKR